VQELYDTYGLGRLTASYPEIRVRFFRNTVFSDADAPLREGLDDLIDALRHRRASAEETVDSIADLRSRLTLSEDEDYFLTRLSYPHLRPEDSAAFVERDLGGRQLSEMVVVLEDRDGNAFRVRHALNPREVGRLHRLFVAANLDVRFRMEHQFLVAINDRTQVIGGVFYEVEDDRKNAHLEKIVVAEPYRKKGVADALMNELFARVRAAGVRTVTTGFFRPEYFYSHGFKIEKRYAGLVKDLDEPDSAARARP
jgi:GNAT superfamily N-acetyltransferase